MKKSIIILLCLVFINLVFGAANGTGRINFTTSSKEPVEVNISSKAYDLVEYYNKYGVEETNDPTRPPSILIWDPPELSPKHLTEEYREAWEELLPYWVSSKATQIILMHNRINDYFTTTKSPQSVPALRVAFRQSLSSSLLVGYVKKQEFILKMFLYIKTDEAFDAFVKSLNLLEKTYANILPPEDSIYNINPWGYYKNRMLKTSRKPITDLDIRGLNTTKLWQQQAAEYDTSDLLPKTKKFVEDLACYRHPYIDYSDDPVFTTNVIGVVTETNTTEQIIEETVITNLIVETVEPIPDIEISTNDVEEIVIVDEEAPSKNRMLIILIIAIAAIIIGVIVSIRKSR